MFKSVKKSGLWPLQFYKNKNPYTAASDFLRRKNLQSGSNNVFLIKKPDKTPYLFEVSENPTWAASLFWIKNATFWKKSLYSGFSFEVSENPTWAASLFWIKTSTFWIIIECSNGPKSAKSTISKNLTLKSAKKVGWLPFKKHVFTPYKGKMVKKTVEVTYG